MSEDLTLTITTNEKTQRAELQLLDAAGVQQAYREIEFGALDVSTRNALFDLRSHLLHYVEKQNHEAEVERIGVVIAETVLGKEIFAKLWAPRNPRTLQIRLPAPARRVAGLFERRGAAGAVHRRGRLPAAPLRVVGLPFGRGREGDELAGIPGGVAR